MLSCPLVVAVYCVISLFGWQPRWRFADAATAGAAVVIGVAYIHRESINRKRSATRCADGTASGRWTLAETIGVRSAWDMQDEEQSLARHLRQMRTAGIGPYRHVSESSPTIDAAVHRLAKGHPAEAKRSKATISPRNRDTRPRSRLGSASSR